MTGYHDIHVQMYVACRHTTLAACNMQVMSASGPAPASPSNCSRIQPQSLPCLRPEPSSLLPAADAVATEAAEVVPQHSWAMQISNNVDERHHSSSYQAELPMKNDQLLTEQKRLPAERGELPIEQGHLPIKQGHLPTEQIELPTDQCQLPAVKCCTTTGRDSASLSCNTGAAVTSGLTAAFPALDSSCTVRQAAVPASGDATAAVIGAASEQLLTHSQNRPTPDESRSGSQQALQQNPSCFDLCAAPCRQSSMTVQSASAQAAAHEAAKGAQQPTSEEAAQEAAPEAVQAAVHQTVQEDVPVQHQLRCHMANEAVPPHLRAAAYPAPHGPVLAPHETANQTAAEVGMPCSLCCRSDSSCISQACEGRAAGAGRMPSRALTKDADGRAATNSSEVLYPVGITTYTEVRCHAHPFHILLRI